MRFLPSLAPVKAGIFPLVKKDGMPEMARKIADELRPLMPVFYDDSGAIGRRYRRQDEIGTPFCITVDGESTSAGTVTVRDRDTLQQERVDAGRLATYLRERITG
jgi:glycyl-tRNA synthetase